MPFATTHILNTWRNDTSIRLTPRGKLLRKVDSKVAAYRASATAANFRELKSAYFLWQVSKEEKYLKQDGWRSSQRNSADNNFPVERLHHFLFPEKQDQEIDDFSLLLAKEAKRDCVRILYGSRAKFLYKDDLKDMVKQAKKDITQSKREKQEKDRQVQSNYNEEQRRESSEIHKIANAIVSQIKSGNVMATAVKQGYHWVKEIAQTVIDFLKGIAQDFMFFVKECWVSIRELLISLVAEICIALVPGINAIVSAAKSVKEYTDAVKMAAKACSQRFKDSKTMMLANKTYQLRTALTTFANNQFLLAMAEAGKQLVKAIDNSFSVISGITLPGNVTKILTLTAFYVQKIAVLAKEYYYTRKINRHLLQINKHHPYLDDNLLKDPLIAAYLIVNATDSTLFATVRDNTDMAVWLDYCNEHLSEFESLKERAQEYIESRKIRLKDLKTKSDEVGPAPFLQQVQNFDKSLLSKVELSKPSSLLDDIRSFDKSTLKSTSTQEKHGHGLLDDIELFNQSNLNSVKTIEKRGLGLLDEVTRFNPSQLMPSDTQVKRGVGVLDQLELFNKKSLSKANTTVKQGVSVLDQVELFNKKVLKQQSTNQFDQLSQLKRLEMELQALDYKLLGQTLLGKSSLSHDLNTLEQTPVNVAQWKKLTWVKFGRRHEITKAIDNGIGKYYQFFRQRKQALIRPRNCKHIPACLAIIAHRIEILQRDVLYPAQKWLSQLDSTHRTSPRRPAMTRLNAACQSERNALQALAMSLEKLHRRYALLSD
ncbi:hypothetical protein [Pseudoalteromonas peptidolytica]|uniref:Uncharacterized protein n=1 Tax=Pseudoalteromonas peptidolytica F12-50-A1 TaxID=1315280 RepID=A0A8I0T2Y0_9GAMM|nr:hypothetical protein [Pseudoalteromonas peptidolytica]MBE0344717.1 hypothetical protein [Pseudoalteromonas peptidolytica F12-50-A1]MDW7551233.1 hypothetical protein [Pseudoalteromonas peptidolytica]GEK08134.1 hypothetical protein PPE03_03830 [Pseudoalteromonas peptidolytica]